MRTLAALLSLVAVPLSTLAGTIHYTATGTVSSVYVTVREDYGGTQEQADAMLSALSAHGVVPDAAFTATLTVDSDPPDAAPGDPDYGIYRLRGFDIAIASYALQCCRVDDPSNGFTVRVSDPGAGGSSTIGAGTYMVTDNLGMVSGGLFDLKLQYDALLFASDALPTALPDSAYIAASSLGMASNAPGDELFLYLDFRTFQVPEPGAGLLAALAVAATAVSRRGAPRAHADGASCSLTSS